MDLLEKAMLFIVSVIILLIGHCVRTTRWTLLLGPEYKRDLRAGFMALSLGYVFNAILPLRIGEFIRALYFAARTRSRLTGVLASIIVERAYDLVAVAVMIMGLALGGFVPLAALVITFGSGAMAALVFGTFYLIDRKQAARRLVWHVANAFNTRIRFVMLDTVMRVIEINRSVRAFAPQFVLQSLLMWVTYLLSYMALASVLQLDFAYTLGFFFAHVLKPVTVEMLETNRPAAVLLTLYAVAPCFLVLLSGRMKQASLPQMGTAMWWLIDPRLELSRTTNNRFSDAAQYDAFLCRHFSGDEGLALDFETYAIQDATVIRRLGGGSDAITAVVQVGPEMRIRKYGTHGAARKLAEQFAWLQHHHEQLPVVQVIGSTAMEGRFFYDMPYSISSRDFYDFIHMNPAEKSWVILGEILESVSAFHSATAGAPIDDATVRTYVRDKVVANYALVKKAFPQLFENGSVCVNGRRVAIATIERFCSEDYLPSRLTLRQQSIIHGDLTIENIIFDPALPRSWMLIDPNTANVMESPLLDYAKLFQSLHLGYEPLNRNNPCGYSEDGVSFFMPRSLVYDDLYKRLCTWIVLRFGAETLREIRLHEIIHYLRLAPYKIRKSPHAGLLFTSCLCLLIDQYNEEYGI